MSFAFYWKMQYDIKCDVFLQNTLDIEKRDQFMKPRTKDNLANIFGGLFSNQRVLNGAKHNAWWVALIMFVVAVILPVIPLTVTVANSYGSQFLNGTTYGFESQITQASLELYVEGYDFEITSFNTLEPTKALNNHVDTTPLKQIVSDAGSNKGEIAFQFYYSAKTKTSDINDLVNDLMEERYISGSTTKPSTPDVGATESADSEIQQTYYRPSFVILFPNGSYEYLAKASTFEVAASQSGDWKNTPVGTKILETVLKIEGYELPTADKVDALVKDSNYFNGVLTNWKVFYNQGYLATKNSALFYQTLLFFGIYAVLVMFMGLMIFLLTRGKRNSFNYLTFWACEKIAMWAAVSPGLLSLILGFMLPSYAVMFFIILMGLRTMWLSMKQLRPSYN